MVEVSCRSDWEGMLVGWGCMLGEYVGWVKLDRLGRYFGWL